MVQSLWHYIAYVMLPICKDMLKKKVYVAMFVNIKSSKLCFHRHRGWILLWPFCFCPEWQTIHPIPVQSWLAIINSCDFPLVLFIRELSRVVMLSNWITCFYFILHNIKDNVITSRWFHIKNAKLHVNLMFYYQY